MKFYAIINRGTNLTTRSMLEESCRQRGIDFVTLDPKNHDFTSLQAIEPGSVLYKVSTDPRSTTLFAYLVNDKVATVFESPNRAVATYDNVFGASLIHQRSNLPIIPTVFDLTRDPKKLQNYVERLGGFPIIVKAGGGSHGVGVMKFDSFDSLKSVTDYLLTRGDKPQFIMRKYIDYAAHARLIVLGDQVIDSIRYHRVPGDFRSNVGKDLKVETKSFDREIERAAIGSVKALEAEFGGVDILIDQQGKGYIAEVNVPCFFPRTQLATGTDIAGALVDHLVKKAARL